MLSHVFTFFKAIESRPGQNAWDGLLGINVSYKLVSTVKPWGLAECCTDRELIQMEMGHICKFTKKKKKKLSEWSTPGTQHALFLPKSHSLGKTIVDSRLLAERTWCFIHVSRFIGAVLRDNHGLHAGSPTWKAAERSARWTVCSLPLFFFFFFFFFII